MVLARGRRADDRRKVKVKVDNLVAPDFVAESSNNLLDNVFHDRRTGKNGRGRRAK